MSSFFTIPGAQKKRKRPAALEAPKKRVAISKSNPKGAGRGPTKPAGGAKKRQIDRDESISGSDAESYDSEDLEVASGGSASGSDDSDVEGETAAERRLRLAERYLENVEKEIQLDPTAFDAEDIDRDIIAERLKEDVAESKGKVYRRLASKFDFQRASHTKFRWNTEAVTSVAVCAPYVYTTATDGYLTKWKLQDLPQNQYPQTTRKKPKKPPAPPKKRPEKVAYRRSDHKKARDKNWQGHIGGILTVAASQDGKFVVTGGSDKRMVVYEADTLRPLRAFRQHRDSVTGVAFRRGTNQLYSCSKDRSVKVWSLDELAYVETLFGHNDDVTDIDALAQERCVSVGARDRTARLWKVVEETQLVFRGGVSEKKSKADRAAAESQKVDPLSLAQEGSMDRVAMIDDELFVTGSDNGQIALWSIQKKKPLFILQRAHGIEPALHPSDASAEEHPDPAVIPPPQPRWITALKAIPYSDIILSGSWDGCVRVWKLSEDKRKIEEAGVLGGLPPPKDAHNVNGVNGTDHEYSSEKLEKAEPLKGIVNDIAIAERGDRGKDGLSIVVAVGKQHRLGSWKTIKDARNGAVVFEVGRMAKPQTNGVHNASDDEAEDED